MLDGEHYALAAAYALVSVAAGLAAVALAARASPGERPHEPPRCGWASGSSAAPARSRASRSTARSRGAAAGDFPLGILAVNLSGTLLLGVLAGAGAATATRERLLGAGLLGAYTTFSTWMLDSHRLATEAVARR